MIFSPINLHPSCTQTIPEEQIESIIKILPQAEELKAINREKTDKEVVESWGPVEKFVDVVGNGVPDLTRRMTLWIFMNEFGTYVLELKRELSDIKDATGQLLSPSNRLYDVLALILSIGNYMNEGSALENTPGFTLDTLANLDACKTTDGSGTLLSFIVKQIMASDPHDKLLEWTDDISTLKDLRVTTQSVGQGVTQLCQGLRTVKRAVEEKKRSTSVFGDESIQDMMITRLSSFYQKSEQVTLKLEEEFTAAKDQMDAVARHFGEDPAFDELVTFGNILSFSKTFIAVVDEEKKARVAALKLAARQPVSGLAIKKPAEKPAIKMAFKPA